MKFSDIKLGMKDSVAKTVTEADIIMYAGVTLDTNPVHLNEEHAKTTMFKKRVAHGMLTAGFVSAVVGTKLPGDGSVYLEQNLKFLAPVYIGDTITAEAEVIEMDLQKKLVFLTTICTNQNGTKVLEGKATIMKKD